MYINYGVHYCLIIIVIKLYYINEIDYIILYTYKCVMHITCCQINIFLLLFFSTYTVCAIRKGNKCINAEPHS